MTTADVTTSKVMTYEVDFDVKSVFGINEFVVVRGKTRLVLLERFVEQLALKHLLNIGDSEKLSFMEQEQAMVFVSNEVIRVISIIDGTEILTSPIPEAVRSPPKFVFARTTTKSTSEYEIIIVGQDCRVEMILIDIAGRANVEWTREGSCQ